MSSDLKRSGSDVSSTDDVSISNKKSKLDGVYAASAGAAAASMEASQCLIRALDIAKSTWLVLDGLSDVQVAEILLQRLCILHPDSITEAMVTAAIAEFRKPSTSDHRRVFAAESGLPKSTPELPIHRALYSASHAGTSEHPDMSSFLRYLDEDMRTHVLLGVTRGDASVSAVVQQTLPFWHWMNGNFTAFYIENDHVIQFAKAGILLSVAERKRLAERWQTFHSPLWFYTLNDTLQAAVVARYQATR